MEEKDVLEIIAENEKRFREEENLKKSITLAIEKQNEAGNKIVYCQKAFKKIKKTIEHRCKILSFLGFTIPDVISELLNSIDVYIKVIEENRIPMLVRMNFILENWLVLEENQNNDNTVSNMNPEKEKIKRERIIKALSMMFPLLSFMDMEASNYIELIQNQMNAMKENKPFILDESAIDKKRYIGNSIDEIRRILNND